MPGSGSVFRNRRCRVFPVGEPKTPRCRSGAWAPSEAALRRAANRAFGCAGAPDGTEHALSGMPVYPSVTWLLDVRTGGTVCFRVEWWRSALEPGIVGVPVRETTAKRCPSGRAGVVAVRDTPTVIGTGMRTRTTDPEFGGDSR